MKPEKKTTRSAEDTARQRSLRVCRKHLEDLRRAHKNPPPDVAAPGSGVLRFMPPVEPSSYRSSPAQLCSELGE